jgi:hypothetical protein
MRHIRPPHIDTTEDERHTHACEDGLWVLVSFRTDFLNDYKPEKYAFHSRPAAEIALWHP